MRSLLGFLSWLLEHWWLALAAAVLVGAYVVGGLRLLAAAFAVVLGALGYRRGRQDGRAEIERREEARQKRLKEAYDAIDARPRDPGDAYRRLSDRSGDW